MGAELKCRARVRGKTDQGLALLETNEVVFRGAQRCTVKLDDVRDRAKVDGDWLMLGDLELQLRAKAARWLEKIKHPKSVLDKLGVKPGDLAWLVGDFEASFTRELMARGLTVGEGVPSKAARLVFFRLHRAQDLEQVEKLA